MMQKKMESVLYRADTGVLEKKMETIIIYEEHQMSYSLNSLKGVMCGVILRGILAVETMTPNPL